MQSSANNSLPDFSIYGYQIVRELGCNYAGGRVTYHAQEIATGQQVVIKQFQFARSATNWSGYNALHREIEVLQRLKHPGIPQYLGLLETSDGTCIIQEYKNGYTLSTQQSFNLDEVKEIARKLLKILVFLQQQSPSVIHRDIKPENILIGENLEQVYLVDFGFARIGRENLALSSMVVGTTGFMPPEILLNQQLTTASDLYGLGATLVCLLSGIKSNSLTNYIDYKYCIDVDNLIHSSIDYKFNQWLKKLIAPSLETVCK